MRVLILFFVLQSVSSLQNVDQFSVLMKKNYLVVDVRTPEEFAQGALPNAVNISVSALDFPIKINRLQKDQPILIYCKSGGRSAQAAVVMKAFGFSKIYELEGGISAWEAAKN